MMTPPRQPIAEAFGVEHTCPNCGGELGFNGWVWTDCPLCEDDDPPDEGDPHEPNDERGWWEDE
jgi:uncharacterized protein (DUF983 family)